MSQLTERQQEVILNAELANVASSFQRIGRAFSRLEIRPIIETTYFPGWKALKNLCFVHEEIISFQYFVDDIETDAFGVALNIVKETIYANSQED